MVELRSGQQVCELREPDTLIFRWAGVVAPDDVGHLFTEARARGAQGHEWFVVFDMSGVQLLPGDTRRRFVSELAGSPLRALAVTRAEFPLRVIVTTVLNVVQVEGSKGVFSFCDDDEAAFQWFRTVREGATTS